jgi:hypothetical protein
MRAGLAALLLLLLLEVVVARLAEVGRDNEGEARAATPATAEA